MALSHPGDLSGCDPVSDNPPRRISQPTKWLIGVSVVAVAVGLYFGIPFAIKAHRIANPVTKRLPLPDSHVSAASPDASTWLQSEFSADHGALVSHFQAQQYLSYCGVATGVMTVNALRSDANVDQDDWFDEGVSEHRTQWDTFFGGMTLSEFAGMLRARGLAAQHHHATAASPDAFRRVVKDNTSNPADLLIVNYSRKMLEQKGWGHFSPVAAYHEETDRVLILDVGAHKYEPSWVKLGALWTAMVTRDSDSGKNRGYVIASRTSASSSIVPESGAL